MLKLQNICKTYISKSGNNVVALNNVCLEFATSDFVSVLGASGCGKTTLLNIIGGLDKQTSGQLIVENVDTSTYKASDFDNYRNKQIGFVFQDYYLIPHLSVLDNVLLGLKLSGVKKQAAKQQAIDSLKQVGLASKIYARPNQLSGGRMQRVAIARALINNPKIILADEPTGALDSASSTQILDLLKEISKTRLVIMVTHNAELASIYSTRVIKMSDGKVVSDTFTEKQSIAEKSDGTAPVTQKKARLNFFTALSLSVRNLLTKKVRSGLMAVAASLGIVGIALVFALTNGMNAYSAEVQQNTLASYPIYIYENYTTTYNSSAPNIEYPNSEIIVPYDPFENKETVYSNIITDEYVQYVNNIDSKLLTLATFYKSYSVTLAAYNTTAEYKRFTRGSISFSELPSEQDFVLSQYDMLGNGKYPTEANEIVLVLDKYNRIDVSMLNILGIEYTLGVNFSFDDILQTDIRIIKNDDYYYLNGTSTDDYYLSVRPLTQQIYNDSYKLKITGILRPKKRSTVTSNAIPFLSGGFKHLSSLTALTQSWANESIIVNAQKNNPTFDFWQGEFFDETSTTDLNDNLRYFGAQSKVNSITLYPKGFTEREQLKAHLDAYNLQNPDAQIRYDDYTVSTLEEIGVLFDSITFALACFAIISLCISSLMIAIIIYVSVIERKKEIGLLRSLGARKIDIFSVFSAEGLIIGLISGILGIIVTICISPIVSGIATEIIGPDNLVQLSPLIAFMLVGLSCVLTFVASIIPSIMAAHKNPVVALRSV